MDGVARAERPLVYQRLVGGFAEVPASPFHLEERWTWLMAAHVVGQHAPGLHYDSHKRMLRLARESRDWAEVAGQALRIALLPLGHLLGRIPHGNTGRSTVAVTKVMEPPEAVQRLIDWAVLGVRLPVSTLQPDD